MLWVVIPAAVVERPGVFPSLSRSAALTKGHRWQVFGILLLIGVVYIVASFIVPRIFAAIGGPVLAQLAQWIVTAAYTAFSAVVTAVGYCTLRLAKEGVGIEEIAKVFD
jgi:hypothetical protein